ncbi:hypothetical protein COO60DRAFT_292218 [Scenedesmus sp. NREL 46B-D3]|nr:hypothetical protein COO60DRAFT_292218 [Scenedesmus sp. NREL 46B-D3]
MPPAPALQAEHAGQLLGLVVAAAPGSGAPPSCASPPATAALHVLGCGHKHTSSRLAIQGSHEMPVLGGFHGLAAARQGSSGSMFGDGLFPQQQPQMQPHVGATAPGLVAGPAFLHTPHHQHLQPGMTRRPSLLRINSSSKDRSVSPFAAVAGAADSQAAGAGAAGGAAGGVPSSSPSAAAAVAAASLNVSPFAAASGGTPGSAGTSNLSPYAAATRAGAPAAAASPFAAASGAGAASPFAAGAGASPFAASAASNGDNAAAQAAAAAAAPIAAASPFAAAACAGGSREHARFSSDDLATAASGGCYTSPFASAASPFVAAASADTGDVRVVHDTNPNPAAVQPHAVSAQQHGSDAGSGRASRAGKGAGAAGSAGVGAAAASGKPALSPFALLQCAQGDASGKC